MTLATATALVTSARYTVSYLEATTPDYLAPNRAQHDAALDMARETLRMAFEQQRAARKRSAARRAEVEARRLAWVAAVNG